MSKTKETTAIRFDSLIPKMAEAFTLRDEDAMELAAELMLIVRIPENGEIPVEWLVEQVVVDSRRVRDTITHFDFAIWARSTVLECIDFLITCGALSGPIVDMNTEDHILLDALVSRTPLLDDYAEGLLEELNEAIA